MIQDEIDKIDPDYQFKSPIEEAIIKRAIHTTADFDYLKNLKSPVMSLKKCSTC